MFRTNNLYLKQTSKSPACGDIKKKKLEIIEKAKASAARHGIMLLRVGQTLLKETALLKPLFLMSMIDCALMKSSPNQ